MEMFDRLWRRVGVSAEVHLVLDIEESFLQISSYYLDSFDLL